MKKILFAFLFIQSVLFCDIKDELFAVHATNDLPDDGELRAGYGKNTEEKWQEIRTTVHFSLGELVRPIGNWMSWEEKKYAIVAPLKTLLPQLININCYDSFILGDLTLTEEMFLVAPEGEEIVGPCRVWYYDRRSCSLRDAIDQLIASEGGFKISMSDQNIDEGYFPAYVNGSDVNTYEFFSPLLAELPHLSLGVRWEPFHGEGWRFAPLEMALMRSIGYPDLPQDQGEMENHLEVLEKTYLGAKHLSEKSKVAVRNLIKLCKQTMSDERTPCEELRKGCFG